MNTITHRIGSKLFKVNKKENKDVKRSSSIRLVILYKVFNFVKYSSELNYLKWETGLETCIVPGDAERTNHYISEAQQAK